MNNRLAMPVDFYRLVDFAVVAVARSLPRSSISIMKPHAPGAVASLVFGILSVITGMVPLLGFFLGMLAIIFSLRASASLATLSDAYQPSGLHTAGLVTGIIGMVFSALATLWALIVIGLIGAIIAAASGQPSPIPVAPPMLW